MTIKDFRIDRTKFHYGDFRHGRPYFIGSALVAPEIFSANINGTERMDDLIRQSIPHIERLDLNERARLGEDLVWAAFSPKIFGRGGARIPYNNKAIDKNDGLAGFVLVDDDSNPGSVREGIYVLERKGKKLDGKLIEFDATNRDMNNYFRHMISSSGIKRRKLHYSVIYTGFSGDGEFTPWRPKVMKREMTYDFSHDKFEYLSDVEYKR